MPINNFIGISQGEQVTGILPVSSFEGEQFLVMATHKGKIKRTMLREFASVRASGLIAISLEEGDELKFVVASQGNGDIIMTTAEGKTIRFSEKEVRAMGRTATGVNAIRLVNDSDEVVGMGLVIPDADLLIITAQGQGKRTPLKEFPTRGRYGQGVIAMRLFPKTGKIIATRVVRPNDEVMMVTTSGMVTRIAAGDISLQSRTAQGVTVMTFKGGKGDSVASVAILSEEQVNASKERSKVSDSIDTTEEDDGTNGFNGNHNGANPLEDSDFVDLAVASDDINED